MFSRSVKSQIPLWQSSGAVGGFAMLFPVYESAVESASASVVGASESDSLVSGIVDDSLLVSFPLVVSSEMSRSVFSADATTGLDEVASPAAIGSALEAASLASAAPSFAVSPSLDEAGLTTSSQVFRYKPVLSFRSVVLSAFAILPSSSSPKNNASFLGVLTSLVLTFLTCTTSTTTSSSSSSYSSSSVPSSVSPSSVPSSSRETSRLAVGLAVFATSGMGPIAASLSTSSATASVSSRVGGTKSVSWEFFFSMAAWNFSSSFDPSVFCAFREAFRAAASSFVSMGVRGLPSSRCLGTVLRGLGPSERHFARAELHLSK
mmetsp:Transcript_19022/g.43507  ORF Transcript_19022/g.43507 Transcript_19022/m.43507 type:complete len:320 (+) Transcript_19022:481-1440(+)